MKLYKTLLPVCLLTLVTAARAELPPLWYEASLDAGSTTNLFADSTGLEDAYGGIGVILEQVLAPAWVIWYDGYGETFAKTNDLSSLNHTLALETSMFLGQRGELWATGMADFLNYSDAYELYNRRSGGVSAGYRHLANQSLRLRLDGRYNITSFPNADTVDVDYREGSLSIGANTALGIPVSLDIEPGFQWRDYGDLASPTSTQYAWLAIRSSTPLDDRTGLVMRVVIRDQLDVGGQDIYALARGGLDASDMLWDGWQAGVTFNRMQGSWFLSGSLDVGHSAYAESVIYTDLPARTDDQVRTTLRLQHTLSADPGEPRITFEGVVGYTNNSSTVGYYTYDGFTIRLGMRISPD